MTNNQNAMQVFNFKDQQVEVIFINGEPYFIGKQVATILGYANPRKALADHVDAEDKQMVNLNTVTNRDGTSGNPNVTVINESGLYSLILSSKLESAKEFKRWVTHEVLPSIRKYGVYATEEVTDKILNNPDFGIKLLEELKAEREKTKSLEQAKKHLEGTVVKQAEQIADMQPKSAYCERILQCPDVIATTGIAKDYGMSARAFNKLLKKLGVQFKQGGIWYLYQHLANNGYMQTKTWEKFDNSGIRHAVTHNYWTQKGRLFLYKTLKIHDILPIMEQLDFYGQPAY